MRSRQALGASACLPDLIRCDYKFAWQPLLFLLQWPSLVRHVATAVIHGATRSVFRCQPRNSTSQQWHCMDLPDMRWAKLQLHPYEFPHYLINRLDISRCCKIHEISKFTGIDITHILAAYPTSECKTHRQYTTSVLLSHPPSVQ